ncbi:MAG TPA: hypothetical protein VEZ11_09560 [Thermoanaerobaculia bacterium]|nr:hypothetical protein [Thermoanaerobaculia bacterium]
MTRAFPPDIVVLDSERLIHARLGRGTKNPQILQAKSYRLAEDTFTPSVVTPELANEAALTEVLRRLRLETGKWEKVSLLLPDSWFRANIADIASLPERSRTEADEMVRWSLKRTLPIPPESLRVAWETLSRKDGSARVFVLAAVDKTLAAIENLFAVNGMEVVLIETIGLNIWNAITAREQATAADRLFLYLREQEFTAVVFRGTQPLFIRTRNLNSERNVAQEMKLSASYLRESLQSTKIENCYVAGNEVDREILSVIGSEFSAPVTTISLSDVTELTPSGTAGYETELTACSGVFSG